METSGIPEMATALALIVGTSLALSAALGDLVAYLTETVKQTGRVPDGYSGIVALVISILLGMGLGGLTEQVADTQYGFGTLLMLGAFAGALMAAGAVKTYKAAGDMNTAPAFGQGMQAGAVRTDVATLTDLDNAMQQTVRHVQEDPELRDIRSLFRELQARHAADLTGDSDIRDITTGLSTPPINPEG